MQAIWKQYKQAAGALLTVQLNDNAEDARPLEEVLAELRSAIAAKYHKQLEGCL